MSHLMPLPQMTQFAEEMNLIGVAVSPLACVHVGMTPR